MQLWQLVDLLDQMSPEQLTAARLSQKLSEADFSAACLAPYLCWKKGSYTRNSVHRTLAYEIIVMAWDAGAVSPVHEHRGQTCWLRVHTGQLRIESYACERPADAGRTGDNIAVVRRDQTLLGPGDIEPDTPDLDVHKVYNAGAAGAQAISLHIYARPFDACITYDVPRQRAALRPLVYSHVGPPVCRPGARK